MITIFEADKIKREDIFARNEPAAEVSGTVREIINNVRINGDKALSGYLEKFDKVKLSDFKVSKEEINKALQEVDRELGQTLFVSESNIKPDGGLIEVKDDKGFWRVVLVSEAKHQGNDIENVQKGIKVGVRNDQDFMVAGNVIERSYKNIYEIANLMLKEAYFPYILFLDGSNFLTKDIVVTRPNGKKITIHYNIGSLNRLDRLTAANYGMPINTNLCKNKCVKSNNRMIMLQASSIYTQGNGGHWDEENMLSIMLEIAKISIQILATDLFEQITKK